MKRILRYELKDPGELTVLQVTSLNILHAQWWKGGFSIWIQDNSKEPKKELSVCLFPTGQEIPDGYFYLGSIPINEANEIYHLFELVKD